MHRRLSAAVIGVLVALLSSALLVSPAAAATARTATLTVSSSTAVVGSTVVLTGRVTRSPKGTRVRIQRASGRRWVTVATVRLRSAGRFTQRVAVDAAGKRRYRVHVPRTAGRRSATSVTRTVAAMAVAPVVPSAAVPGSAAPSSVVPGTAASGPATAQPVQTPAAPTCSSPAATTGTQQSSSTAVSVTYGKQDLPWGAETCTIRWDTPGAFTHSMTPSPAYTLAALMGVADHGHPEIGAEYLSGNSTLRNADVRFDVTGTSFAIRYVSSQALEAMVWLDGRPVRSEPIVATSDAGDEWRWVRVDLPTRRTVSVRFAGPLVFTGVDHRVGDPVTVTAGATPFTLGVVSDSYYEQSFDMPPSVLSAAPTLSTLTGFRVWNMAENGTGYVNDASGSPSTRGIGSHAASTFGSAQRLAGVTDAPIDALIVNGSLNDHAADPEEHRIAVDRFLDDIARLRPGLPVVLIGLEPVSIEGLFTDVTDARLEVLNDTLRRAAASHANVVGFIDPYAENWLTGYGSTAHPTGEGNQDLYVGQDGAHLNGAGQAFYQGRVAARLKQMGLGR